MYAIILGQLSSEITSKTIIFYHNTIVQSFEIECDRKTRCAYEENEYNQNDDLSISRLGQTFDEAQADGFPTKCEALRYSRFTRPHRGDSFKLEIRSFVQYYFTALCLLIPLTVMVACLLKSFTYEISGLLGVALNFEQEEDKSVGSSSVFSIMSTLMDSADTIGKGKYYIGLGSICAFLILTVLVFPIIEACLLLVQWLRPMEKQSLLKIQRAVDYLEAWQCMEVYFAAVVASSLQSNGISKFFAKTICEPLTDVFRALVYWGFLEKNDGQCIAVKSSLKLSTLVFLVAPLALYLLRAFIRDAAEQRIKEENNRLTLSASSNTEVEQFKGDFDIKAQVEQLRPTPVHFTDRFRWALCSEAK